MSRHAFSLVVFLMFASIFVTACSSGPKRNTNTAEGAFLAAKDLEESERFEEALQKYAEVKNKFPYNRRAVEAELRMADVYFKKEAYVEAQASYELFKELHPRHPRSDYVTFRLAMSYFHQLPSSIDRDLSVAHKSILFFDEVLSRHPQSKHIKESKKKKSEAIEMLAKKELYIADFYRIRDMYDSALRRYENLINSDIIGTGTLLSKALFGAGVSALETGEGNKGKLYLTQLIRNHPKSDLASEAKDKMESYGNR